MSKKLASAVAITFLATQFMLAPGCNSNSSGGTTGTTGETGSSGGGHTGGLENVTTYHNDLSRDGQNLNETILTTSNVNSTSFGKVGSLPVDGVVYAQPLIMTNVMVPGTGATNLVFVATEHDSVYAFNTTSLSTTPVWHRNFVSDCVTTPATPSNCTTVSGVSTGAPNITPEIGITSTPVIDPVAGTMYVVAVTLESNIWYWRVHALDITTGAEQAGSPVVIDSSYPGSGAGTYSTGLISFDPVRQLQRAGLVLESGLLYIPFTSFDDQEPTHGWMFAYNASTMEPVSAWMTTPNTGIGTIWQAGGAPAVDDSGNLFFATGNGDGSYFETANGTYTGVTDYSTSVLKLVFSPEGGFDVLDYFTPYNFVALNVGDVELGSGGVMLLPNQPGPNPHLLVAGGKQGTVYLINRDNMGKLNNAAGASSDPNIVQEVTGVIPGGKSYGAGLYSTASYFNGNVYLAAAGDYLRSIPMANGLLNTASMQVTTQKIVNRGATTSISANGTTNGIIWYMDASAYTYGWTPGSAPPTLTGGPPVLYAYDATDLSLLYASNQVSTDAAGCPAGWSGSNPIGYGCAVKFALPTVANGQVFVGTDTEVTVYGLRN